MKVRRIFLLATVLCIAFIGCKKKDTTGISPKVKSDGISLKLIKEIDGFSVPECVVVDKTTDNIYVSNIVTSDQGYWVDDSNGFISLLDSNGNIKELNWLSSTDAMPIHAPKGMAILDGYLYFTDNTKLKRVLLSDKSKVEIIELPETEKLNDLASDGKSVWVSDTGMGKVYKVQTDASYKEIPTPESTNGLTCWKGKVFAVSWDLHEVYELDPEGLKAPVSFGLAEHFVNLDAIEVLANGTFIVTDFGGNKVAAIKPDRKTVIVLAEAQSAADFGIDRQRNLIYVPMLQINKARVYEINAEETN